MFCLLFVVRVCCTIQWCPYGNAIFVPRKFHVYWLFAWLQGGCLHRLVHAARKLKQIITCNKAINWQHHFAVLFIRYGLTRSTIIKRCDVWWNLTDGNGIIDDVRFFYMNVSMDMNSGFVGFYGFAINAISYPIICSRDWINRVLCFFLVLLVIIASSGIDWIDGGQKA